MLHIKNVCSFLFRVRNGEGEGVRILHEPYFYLYGTFCKEMEEEKKRNEMKHKKYRIQ